MSVNSRRQRIGVAFDGTLHSFTSGWEGLAKISDCPADGAIRWLESLVRDHDVAILSQRSWRASGRQAMQDWLADWATEAHPGCDLAWIEQLQWPELVPQCDLVVDAQVIPFDGRRFPSRQELADWRPWYALRQLG